MKSSLIYSSILLSLFITGCHKSSDENNDAPKKEETEIVPNDGNEVEKPDNGNEVEKPDNGNEVDKPSGSTTEETQTETQSVLTWKLEDHNPDRGLFPNQAFDANPFEAVSSKSEDKILYKLEGDCNFLSINDMGFVTGRFKEIPEDKTCEAKITSYIENKDVKLEKSFSIDLFYKRYYDHEKFESFNKSISIFHRDYGLDSADINRDSVNVSDLSLLKYFKRLDDIRLIKFDYMNIDGNSLKEIMALVQENTVQNVMFVFNTQLSPEIANDLDQPISLKITGSLVNLSLLKDINKLVDLDLSENQILDFSPLKDLKNLTKLIIDSCEILDLSPLKDLKNLTYLSLSSNNITDISSLKDLKNLTYLELSSNNITDISSLKDLKNLTDLSLSYNNITDISSLKDLKNLTDLSLSYNNITDISSLKDLKNLTYLRLFRNDIIMSEETCPTMNEDESSLGTEVGRFCQNYRSS